MEIALIVGMGLAATDGAPITDAASSAWMSRSGAGGDISQRPNATAERDTGWSAGFRADGGGWRSTDQDRDGVFRTSRAVATGWGGLLPRSVAGWGLLGGIGWRTCKES